MEVEHACTHPQHCYRSFTYKKIKLKNIAIFVLELMENSVINITDTFLR